MFRAASKHTLFAGECLTLVLCLVAVTVAGPSANQGPQAPSKGDKCGDPLPDGALTRLGTIRWRHADTVTFVAFLADGKAVLTGAQDNTLRLWDRATGKEIRRFMVPGAQPPVGPGMRRVNVWGGAGRGGPIVSLSPNGQMLAALFPNNTIQLWDVATGGKLRSMPGPQNGVGTLLFAPDSRMLAVAGGDRTIHLLDAESGREIRQLKAKQPMGGGVRILIGGGFVVNGANMTFSPDSKTLATAEQEFDQAQGKVSAYLKLTSVETGEEIRRIDVPQGLTSAIAYSYDHKILASVTGNIIHLRDPATGKNIRDFNSPGGVSAMVFAPGSKTLATKGGDNVARLWDVETGKEVQQFGALAAAVGRNLANRRFTGSGAGDLAFSADGKTIAIGAGNTVRIWDVVSGKEKDLTGGHRGPVSAVSVSTDGKTVVSRDDNVIRRWDRRTGEPLGQFHEPKNTTCVAFSPDGQTAAFGGTDAVIRVVDIVTGKEKKHLLGHANGTASLVFAPDGRTLASHGVANNMIRLNDAIKGSELQHIVLQADNPVAPGGGFAGNRLRGPALSLAFSPDSSTVIALAAPSAPRITSIVNGQPQLARATATAVRMWDVATAKEIRKIVLPAGLGTGSIAVSPDGRVLAMENPDQTISLIEIASGKERGHLGSAAPAVQPQPGMGGRVFAVGGFGGIARQSAPGSTLAFSPDGTLLACRKATANTIWVWQVDHAKAIGQYIGHDGPISALTFTPDGKALATGSSDTTVLVWDVARLKRPPAPAAAELQPAETADLWTDLIADDAGKAFQSILKLARASRQTLPLLRERVKPAIPVDPRKIAKLIANLDNDDFEARSGAVEALAKLGDLAVPALQQVLTGSQPSLETRRRVEQLLSRLTGGALTPEQVRLVRVVEVLERTNAPEAWQLLQTLADGAPGALATRQARAALDRKK
jgi:WD40 repeat protein